MQAPSISVRHLARASSVITRYSFSLSPTPSTNASKEIVRQKQRPCARYSATPYEPLKAVAHGQSSAEGPESLSLHCDASLVRSVRCIRPHILYELLVVGRQARRMRVRWKSQAWLTRPSSHARKGIDLHAERGCGVCSKKTLMAVPSRGGETAEALQRRMGGHQYLQSRNAMMRIPQNAIDTGGVLRWVPEQLKRFRLTAWV